MKSKRKKLLAASLASTLCAGVGAFAQSSDALLDKLVEKGILNVKEANELRAEADKNFTQAYSVKSGMPEWVSALKFNGDLRLRYDNISIDDPSFTDRHRFRYRMRFGATASLMDNFELGLRLISGENAKGGFSTLDPISGNANFDDNASKKLIGVDLAYVRWAALNSPVWGLSITGGKMENPFVLSDMMFDSDYTPEGLAEQLSYTLNEQHTLRLNGGAFMLDELSKSSRDPFFVGGQVRWDANWTEKVQSSAGAALLGILNPGSLATSELPDQNKGNLRDAGGKLVNEYTSVALDSSVTYNLESAPLYPGTFPIRLGADYIHNLGADSRNNAYSVGITFGKSGKKGTWDFTYRWKYLEGDAWWEETTDSDTGVFYQSKANPRGASSGYQPGTNLRGHYLRAAYSPFDSFTFSATYYLFEAIDEFPPGSKSASQRLQIDALWKF